MAKGVWRHTKRWELRWKEKRIGREGRNMWYSRWNKGEERERELGGVGGEGEGGGGVG